MWQKIKDALKRAMRWLNDGKRWHDLAHTLNGIVIVCLVGGFTGCWFLGLLAVVIYNVVKEFFLDSWEGWDNFHDILQYLLGAGIGIAILLVYKHIIIAHYCCPHFCR